MVKQALEIILIDDDESILGVLSEMFTSNSEMNITTESNSEKALELVVTRRYDIVITDLMMEPGPGGIEILRAVKRISPETLVIIITGYASLETTLDAIKYGAYDYITKPFQIEEFDLLLKNAAEKITMKSRLEALRSQVSEIEYELQKTRDENARLLKYIENMRRSSQEMSERGETGTAVPPFHMERTVSSYEKASKSSEKLFQSELQRLRYLQERGKIGEEDFVTAVRKLQEESEHRP